MDSILGIEDRNSDSSYECPPLSMVMLVQMRRMPGNLFLTGPECRRTLRVGWSGFSGQVLAGYYSSHYEEVMRLATGWLDTQVLLTELAHQGCGNVFWMQAK